jgi:hypothetical protein
VSGEAFADTCPHMAITSLTSEPPIRRTTRRPSLDYEHLEAAATLAEEGRPMEALLQVFAHLLPGQKLPDLAKETFSFTQGSSKVTTRIENDDVVITVPLVKLPDGGRAIAALRYVLTNISATGQLYQPRLRGDDIHLEFRDRLARLHPAKVVEVLRHMPAEADDNDDFLIAEFGALPLERASIVALDDAELARADALWRSHWNVVEELLKECQRKRSMFFLNEMTAYALHRIEFALPLGGILASRLSQAASTFQDGDIDPTKRETALAKCAKEMKAISIDELKKSLGHASYAISPHDDGTPAVLSGYLGEGNYMETIDRLRGSGKPFEAALALISTYNYLLNRFSWPEPVDAALNAGLLLVSGKPWREAASLLADHAKALAEEFADDEEEDEEEDGDTTDDDDDEDGEDDDDDGEDADEDGDE